MKKRTFVSKIIITLIVIPVFYYDIKAINMILYTIKTGIFGYDQDISTSITRIETLLEEKYGEKFEVVEYGYKLYCDALVRPVSHPDCFFTVRYHFTDTDDGISYDTYVKRNVELKFKHLAEEKLTDFKYDHYVDVSINNSADVPSSDPDISIEEFKKIYPQETTPSYYIFFTYDTLKEISYEELYRYVNSIAEIPEQDNAFVVTFFFINSILKASLKPLRMVKVFMML